MAGVFFRVLSSTGLVPTMIIAHVTQPRTAVEKRATTHYTEMTSHLDSNHPPTHSRAHCPTVADDHRHRSPDLPSRGSALASDAGRPIRATVAPLKRAEIRLVYVIVAVDVLRFATGLQVYSRA